jgi:hypothetical protein
MKQTAVEWLAKELEVYGEPTKLVIIWEDLDSLVKQAKEIEKEQMLNFPKEWKDSCLSGNYDGEVVELKSLEQYYTSTYGSKGSDDHIVDTNEMVDQVPDVRKMVEISDEDIIQQADREFRHFEQTKKDIWYNACKWYREQLKLN